VRKIHRALVVASLIVSGGIVGAKSGGFIETDLVVNQLANGIPTLTDKNGIVHVATVSDARLVNPWGLASSGSSPLWASDNGAGLSTLYNGAGTPQSLVVSIPAPGQPLGTGGAPTGTVFNIASGLQAFQISGFTKAGAPTSAPASFLFATEDGTILGWNPNVNPAGFDPAKAGTYAIIAVDNSPSGAVYKGLAIAVDTATNTAFLYASNFHSGAVDVFGSSFGSAGLSGDAFTDPHLPHRYAPFNIVPIVSNGVTKLFVTYAVQDAAKHDDVAGESHGIVDTYDFDGNLLQRFAQHGQLNSPWGVAMAPADFGEFGGDILIGNFGNGHINAFDPDSGRFINKLRTPRGQAIVIDGLWALRVGNGGNGGDSHKIYFTAGPNDESDGLFGNLMPNP
jgi:uncharacterized protein (TIGR03118 family)